MVEEIGLTVLLLSIFVVLCFVLLGCASGKQRTNEYIQTRSIRRSVHNVEKSPL